MCRYWYGSYISVQYVLRFGNLSLDIADVPIFFIGLGIRLHVSSWYFEFLLKSRYWRSLLRHGRRIFVVDTSILNVLILLVLMLF